MAKVKTAVDPLEEVSDEDLEDLCDAAESAILDGGGFGWLRPPARAVLGRYFRGVILVPERHLFVGRLDGRIAAGVSDAGGARGPVLWSQRQPLGLSSPKPISVAVATASVGGPSLSGCAADSGAGTANCTATVGAQLTLASAVISNFDLCDTPHGCADPLNATLQRATTLAATNNSAAAISSDNLRFWRGYWNSSWVSMPGDPTLERFYYGTSYMIGAASREGKLAAGLCRNLQACAILHNA